MESIGPKECNNGVLIDIDKLMIAEIAKFEGSCYVDIDMLMSREVDKKPALETSKAKKPLSWKDHNNGDLSEVKEIRKIGKSRKLNIKCPNCDWKAHNSHKGMLGRIHHINHVCGFIMTNEEFIYYFTYAKKLRDAGIYNIEEDSYIQSLIDAEAST